MDEMIAPHYALSMIMTNGFQPASANRVTFRRLSPVRGYTSSSTPLHTFSRALPNLHSCNMAKLACHDLRVPNWALAASCVAVLGLSVTLSAGFAQPKAQAPSPQQVSSAVVVSSPQYVWAGSEVTAQLSTPVASSHDGQVASLEGEISSMGSNLQQLQQQNDALRNLVQQQNGALSQAHSQLAASQDSLNGMTMDNNSRLQSMQQGIDSHVSRLQGEVTTADNLVNQIRKMLGMPPVSTTSGS